MTTTDDLEERRAAAAWTRVPGAGPRTMAELRGRFGSLAAAWAAPEPFLRAAGLRERAIEARRALDPAALWAVDATIGARVVLDGDADYPAALHELADPPVVLWALGAWPPPVRAIAIVGARAATPYGERHARRLGRDLAAADVAVVSGAAEGIDRAAHEGALEAGMTVGVLGCGFRHVYPAHHRRLYREIAARGLLLTEFPPDAPPVRGNFPRRNRLIAALARATVVVEARARSGSLITADHALDLSREVMAVPGPAGAPGSEGPHALLRDGAHLVESAADVLRICGWDAAPPAPPPVLGLVEGTLLAALGDEVRSTDALLGATGLPPGKAVAALVGLELAGLVRSVPGARWVRT